MIKGGTIATPFLLVFLALSLVGCIKRPVTERDREIFVRVADLADYLTKVPEDAARFEKFEKVFYCDGSWELTYEFELPEGDEREGLRLVQVTASVGRSKGDAIFSHATEDVAYRVVLRTAGIKLETKENFFQYGDKSVFYLLKSKEGNPIGNYFVTRKGTRVYAIALVGAYFDDAEMWGELVKPKLEKFLAYKP